MSTVALYLFVVLPIVAGVVTVGRLVWKLANRGPGENLEALDASGFAVGPTETVWIRFACGCEREAIVPSRWLETGAFPLRCHVQRHRARVLSWERDADRRETLCPA